MEFFVDNDNVEKKYKKIYKSIFTLRNGETHHEMKKFGLNYNKAFGVNVVSLRDLAKEFEPSHLLANKLWSSGLREGKIIATLLENISEVDVDQLDRWVLEAESNEILEQLCINLYTKHNDILSMINTWLYNDNASKQKISLLLIARIAMLSKNKVQCSFSEFENLLPPLSIYVADSYTQKLCIRACVRIAALSAQMKVYVEKYVKTVELENSNWAFICSEIKAELNFLA